MGLPKLMTIKSDISTLKIPASKPAPSGADFTAQWTQARLAYPLYAALATQFGFAPLPHPAGEQPPIRPTREVFDADLNFLSAIDEKVKAYQIRQLPPATLNASEESLRAFLSRQLRKQDKVTSDRDKIDLLTVQYFALCAPEELYRKEIALSDVAFAARLESSSELRTAVQAWLEAQQHRPEDVTTEDWLRFEQEKHESLLAVA